MKFYFSYSHFDDKIECLVQYIEYVLFTLSSVAKTYFI